MHLGRSLFLIGLRGVGKTDLGLALAQVQGLPFFDLDDRIEEREGRSCASLIREKGIAAFREAEALAFEALVEERGDQPSVLALGGGAVENGRVVEGLKRMKGEGALCVWLTADLEVCLERLRGGEEDRPLLVGRDREEEFRLLAARRFPIYRELADLCFQSQGEASRVLATRLAGLLG